MRSKRESFFAAFAHDDSRDGIPLNGDLLLARETVEAGAVSVLSTLSPTSALRNQQRVEGSPGAIIF